MGFPSWLKSWNEKVAVHKFALSHDRKSTHAHNVTMLEMCEIWEIKGGKTFFYTFSVLSEFMRLQKLNQVPHCHFFLLIWEHIFFIILTTIHCNTVLVWQCWIFKDLTDYTNQLRSISKQHNLSENSISTNYNE